MTFGIILYDEDRRIVAIDDTAASVFQKASRELLGRSLLDFVPQPDRAQMAEARATFERFGEASGQFTPRCWLPPRWLDDHASSFALSRRVEQASQE